MVTRSSIDPIEEARARVRLRYMRGRAATPGMSKVGVAAERLTRKSGAKKLPPIQVLKRRWREIAGEQLYKFCRPERLSGGKDGRVLTLDSTAETYFTLEKKPLIVDSFAKWRINNVLRYYEATRFDERIGERILQERINEGLRNEISRRDMHEVVSGERDELMDNLTAELNRVMAQAAGIEVNRGIKVDRFLRTNVKNVYALGDCSEVEGNVMLYVLPLMAGARALAKTLAGTETAVAYGPMPVAIKTPACPVVVAPTPNGTEGEWEIEADGLNVKALFKDTAGTLRGFALTGEATSEKNALAKQLPPLLD